MVLRVWHGNGMTTGRSIIAMMGVCTALFVAGVQAADTSHGAGETHHGAAPRLPGHVVGVFLGATDGDQTDSSYGIEYEYRAHEVFGLGAIWERTPDGHHGDGVTVRLAAVYLHPFAHGEPLGGVRLTLGAGREKVDGHGSEDIWRIGLAYDIELGRFAVAPSVSVDFVDDEEVTVYGVVISTHF